MLFIFTATSVLVVPYQVKVVLLQPFYAVVKVVMAASQGLVAGLQCNNLLLLLLQHVLPSVSIVSASQNILVNGLLTNTLFLTVQFNVSFLQH